MLFFIFTAISEWNAVEIIFDEFAIILVHFVCRHIDPLNVQKLTDPAWLYSLQLSHTSCKSSRTS